MHQLEQILHSIEFGDAKSLPPVEQWQPDRSGQIDIHIDAQGQWWHEGERFERQALVDLFATILRFDAGQYYLVTPVEKLRISVEDVPFLADSLISIDNKYQLLTQCGDIIPLDENCKWQLRPYQQQEVPYICVRHNLWARLDRHVFYQMIDLALEQANGTASIDKQLYFHAAKQSFSLGSVV